MLQACLPKRSEGMVTSKQGFKSPTKGKGMPALLEIRRSGPARQGNPGVGGVNSGPLSLRPSGLASLAGTMSIS